MDSFPTTTGAASARTTAPNHTLLSAPTATGPTTVADGATYAPGASMGAPVTGPAASANSRPAAAPSAIAGPAGGWEGPARRGDRRPVPDGPHAQPAGQADGRVGPA